ncbi:MAG TPA: fibronectin type III domain-containing protein [Blastocatellia bacterium]
MMLGLMWRKKSNRRKGLTLPRLRRLKVVVTAAIVLGLFAAWTLLAYSGALDSVFRQKSKRGGAVSPASFNSNSPSKEYVYAGGRLVATEEATGTTLSAPTNLRATTTSSTQIHISWNSVTGAARYELQRSSNYGNPNNGFAPVSSNITQPFYDDTVGTSGTNASYIYRVLAFDAGGNPSPSSNIDLATAITFLDDPVQTGMTVKDFHILRLRDAINYVRIAAGIVSFNGWTDASTLTQVVIKKEHVQELRDKLDEARSMLGLPQPAYTDPTITRYVTRVSAAHIQQLRQLVKGYRTFTG